MPRLLVVESDVARREALHLILVESGYDFLHIEHHELPADLAEPVLILIGDGDLALLQRLPRTGDQLAVPVVAVIDPSNVQSILACLDAGVAGFVSRHRTGSEILAKIRSVMDNIVSPKSRPEDANSPATRTPENASKVIEALSAACDDLSRLQAQYESELALRRNVEKALSESDAFYHSLVETLPLAMLRKDLNGRFTFVNRLLCEAFKRHPEDIIGRTDYDFFPRELAEKYRADDRRVLEERCNFETTEEFQAPTGELRFTHVVKSPVYDSSGQIVGIQGIFSDVTEKERAERELVQTKSRLQAVLDAATQVAIISMDVHGAIDLFNPGAERMLGYTMSEMLGKSPEVLHLETEVLARSAELSRRFRRPIRGFEVFVEYARRGDHEEREWTYVRKDGRHLRVALSVTAKRDHEGRINGFLSVATDITARHQAEAELLKAKEAAEAASRAKSDFLANMSHEIRTPLNAVIGMTELVRDTELNPTQREYLGMVQESGEALLAIINDILDFSKIEAGKLSLERIGFNLRELLGDTMKSLALRAHRKGLELACHVTTSVPVAVEGDPHRLRQVVVNLVGNAIKFTEQGEVVLDVQIERTTDEGITLHFQVTDTGIGISPDQLHTIFEAFEQADTSTTRRYGGTGLGLAISSRLVELMGGCIWVESEIGKGSTFHFLVRFGLQAADLEADASTIHPSILQGLPVLIVDDNATNRRILAEILSNWAMSPCAVSSVPEAVAELKSMATAGTPFAIVLTDANMPDVDGFELARQIQENRVLCRSMVMMLTSGDRPGDVRRCEQLGVAAYLVKPIKQSELLDAILVAIGDHSAFSPGGEALANVERKAVKPRSILLAEDSVINQKLATGLLEKWGHRVSVANDGREAVALSAQQPFDLVLMDVQMPEMDGLDATRAIRERERTTGVHLPILAMTAHAMKGDRERCLEAGMDDYLMKPIRSDQLFQALERVGSGVRESAKDNGNPAATRLLDHVDWDAALAAVNQDRDLLRSVVEAFLEEGPKLQETMLESIPSGQAQEFQRAAHTLKSGLRMFGVGKLANDMETVELAARAGSVCSATTMDALALRVRAVLDELTTYLQSDSGSGSIKAPQG